MSEPAGSTGVSIETEPICDFAGQVTAAFDFSGKLALGQNSSPGAVAGLRPTPRGSVTVALLTVEELTGAFEKDVTDLVKGTYGWQAADAGFAVVQGAVIVRINVNGTGDRT